VVGEFAAITLLSVSLLCIKLILNSRQGDVFVRMSYFRLTASTSMVFGSIDLRVSADG